MTAEDIPTLIDSAAVIISLLALILAFLSFLHSKKTGDKALQLQESDSKSRLRNKLQELSFLLTQSMIESIRVSSGISKVKSLINSLPPEIKENNEVKKNIVSIEDCCKFLEEGARADSKTEEAIMRVWDVNKYGEELESKVHKYCALIEANLARRRHEFENLENKIKEAEEIMSKYDA